MFRLHQLHIYISLLISLLFVKIITSNFKDILRETWSFICHRYFNFEFSAIIPLLSNLGPYIMSFSQLALTESEKKELVGRSVVGYSHSLVDSEC